MIRLEITNIHCNTQWSGDTQVESTKPLPSTIGREDSDLLTCCSDLVPCWWCAVFLVKSNCATCWEFGFGELKELLWDGSNFSRVHWLRASNPWSKKFFDWSTDAGSDLTMSNCLGTSTSGYEVPLNDFSPEDLLTASIYSTNCIR